MPSALERFTELFQRGTLQSRSGRPSDCSAAMRIFDQAQALLPELPDAQRHQAEFGIEIRRAQAYQRADRKDRAAALVTAARARFSGDPKVWQGSHRVLALVILWACSPLETFLASAGLEDREFLLSEAANRYEKELAGSLGLVRASLWLLSPDTEAKGVVLLQRTWEELRARTASGDPERLAPWRVLCAQTLFAHHYERREFERARPWLDELPAADADPPRSKLALELGDYGTAVERARAAAERDPLWWAQVGDGLEVQGRYEEALDAYRKCRESAKEPLDQAAVENGMGDAMRGLQRLDEARRHYETELDLLKGAVGTRAASELAEVQKDLGLVAEANSDSPGARAAFTASLLTTEQARAELPMDVLGDAYLGSDALVALDGLLRTAPATKEAAFESVLLIDRWRARGLLDWMAAPPRGEAWLELRRRVAALLLAGDERRRGERLRELEQERARLGVAARPRPSGLTLDALRGMLVKDSGTTFLVSWLDHERGAARGGNRARLYVLCKDSALAFDLGTKARAERLVRSAAAAVTSPTGDPWPALRLASEFFLPNDVRVAISGASRVVWSPDPALALLPLEALPCGEDALGLRVPVERAPSLAVWRELRYRSARGSRRIVVDSVEDFGTSGQLGLAPLRFSSREGARVAELASATVRLSGAAATLPAIRGALGGGGVDLLHVSAHAVAHPGIPSASSLLLADGPAPFSALADLPLLGSLVVLSACTSAGADSRAGEGVVGLLWGPLAAGARGVVASIYEVNQQATADLMTVFHHERLGCEDDAEALRRARKRLALSPNYVHPHYWSGFAVFAAESPSTSIGSVRELPLWAAAAFALIASGIFVTLRSRKNS